MIFIKRSANFDSFERSASLWLATLFRYCIFIRFIFIFVRRETAVALGTGSERRVSR